MTLREEEQRETRLRREKDAQLYDMVIRLGEMHAELSMIKLPDLLRRLRRLTHFALVLVP